MILGKREHDDEEFDAMVERFARELAEVVEFGPKCMCGHRFQEHAEKCVRVACGCLRFRQVE